MWSLQFEDPSTLAYVNSYMCIQIDNGNQNKYGYYSPIDPVGSARTGAEGLGGGERLRSNTVQQKCTSCTPQAYIYSYILCI